MKKIVAALAVLLAAGLVLGLVSAHGGYEDIEYGQFNDDMPCGHYFSEGFGPEYEMMRGYGWDMPGPGYGMMGGYGWQPMRVR